MRIIPKVLYDLVAKGTPFFGIILEENIIQHPHKETTASVSVSSLPLL